MWTGTSPWFSDFSRRDPRLATLVGLVAWTALVPLLLALYRRATSVKSMSSPASPP
jgi:hypothetical protein